MTSSVNVIRLVGGPPKLDGSLCDLRLSDRDRADATGDRFVRAVKGSSVTALSALQTRCTDRARADELAASWRAIVYRPAGARRHGRRRPVVYRFAGHYSLESCRDERGRWGLAVSAELAGPALSAPRPEPGPWPALEASVDAAAGRFSRVAALVPGGVHVDRVRGAHDDVATCVADAVRLCAVGSAVAPTGAGADAAQLVARVTELVQAIDGATTELVTLHLALGRAVDPADHVAGLASGWAELAGG